MDPSEYDTVDKEPKKCELSEYTGGWKWYDFKKKNGGTLTM